MPESRRREESAVIASRMYYQSGHSTNEIARYLKVSRSTVSRLLSYAKESGIVEIRIRDEHAASALDREIKSMFPSVDFRIIEVRRSLTPARVVDAVAQYAAHAIIDLVEPHSTIGLAWGNTISAVIGHLRPHPIRDVSVVQLNGAGNRRGLGISYAADVVARFAQVFSATDYLFPVPAFFDHPETKEALWRERSIQQILAVQQRADMLLFSTGALVGDTISYVYSAGYLAESEVADLRQEGVIGDIATVFFKESGSADLAINRRCSGPPLSLYRQSKKSVCVAAGAAKIPGLMAALHAGYITHLIIDELTAAELLHRLRSRDELRVRDNRFLGGGPHAPSAAGVDDNVASPEIRKHRASPRLSFTF